jgi:hypothetical protein
LGDVKRLVVEAGFVTLREPPLFSTFPMFVPSLSWQNDRFCVKWLEPKRFSHRGPSDLANRDAPQAPEAPKDATLARAVVPNKQQALPCFDAPFNTVSSATLVLFQLVWVKWLVLSFFSVKACCALHIQTSRRTVLDSKRQIFHQQHISWRINIDVVKCDRITSLN